MTTRTRLYFDGSSRPTGLTTAVVLRGQVHIAAASGTGASMDAEWLALLAAIRLARAAGVVDPLFLGDSRVVIGQATGAARARGAALDYLDRFMALTEGRPPRIRYVKRSQNLAGIALDRHHDGMARPPHSRVPPA